jgi:hypothetical protein
MIGDREAIPVLTPRSPKGFAPAEDLTSRYQPARAVDFGRQSVCLPEQPRRPVPRCGDRLRIRPLIG